MATLLLRLQAPMQSWGVQSRFGVRDTAREPSKSGVIGLLCAALGRNREEPVDDLATLKMGIRIDQPGRVLMDFHTAKNVLKASGGTKDTELSRRYYLADAIFLVGFESENLSLLKILQAALAAPVWTLYLGRKAFVPSPPIYLPDGLRETESLKDAFRFYPWLGNYETKKPEEKLRLVLDDVDGEILRNDHPISFAKRQFAPRRLHVDWVNFPPDITPDTGIQEDTL